MQQSPPASHRTGTASAEVLALLMNGDMLTGMDGVHAASTTRLAAHIHYLSVQYGVETIRGERAVGCKDGRVVTVTTYRLPSAVVETASAGAVARWIATVRSDRAAKQTKAALAQRKASNINAAHDPLHRTQEARRARAAGTAPGEGRVEHPGCQL